MLNIFIPFIISTYMCGVEGVTDVYGELVMKSKYM